MSHLPLPSAEGLLESALNPDPIQQFTAWLGDAVRANIAQPHAMVLATATPDGRPSARVVLMKNVDERGFVFVTHFSSRKGMEIASNPRVALVFHWDVLGRQVRIEGTAETVSEKESDDLFATRPRENQLSSAASPQSTVITLEVLDRRFEKLHSEYDGKNVPRPVSWGGYRIRPDRMEFWQHRFARLNDRIVYIRGGNPVRPQWKKLRLAP